MKAGFSPALYDRLNPGPIHEINPGAFRSVSPAVTNALNPQPLPPGPPDPNKLQVLRGNSLPSLEWSAGLSMR
jgi:hypothetical protein